MKTSQMLKVIPIATLALLMSCSGNKSEEATETQNENCLLYTSPSPRDCS